MFERGNMVAELSVVGASARQFDLLGGGAELVDLSLLAAQTAAVLDQLARNAAPTAEDRAVLGSMAQFLSDAAHSVQFFGSGGREGAPPSGALAAARLDAAIDAVADEGHQADHTVVAGRLLDMSARLREAEEKPWQADEADNLGLFFSGLARLALSQTGHVGEVTASY
jgi:hypothetical protein